MQGSAAGTSSEQLDELKEFALLHARAQGIPPRYAARLMAAIGRDGGDTPDSWVKVWSYAASQRAANGDPLGACRFYNMARFPFVDGAARAAALRSCIASFDSWRTRLPDVTRITIEHEGGSFGCWVSGLSRVRPRPLLVVLGGIVSIKEQWAQFLPLAHRLDFAIAVTEMPGVGENSLPYRDNSWRMLTAVLDSLKARADARHTHAVAMSFGGHLALRCALHDSRIRGIVTVGAPVTALFRDAGPKHPLPATTLYTLAHLTSVAPAEVYEFIRPWALTEDELASIDIPVHYVASRRDDITPPHEANILKDHLSRFELLEHDDVHGSPHHLLETRIWVLRSLLRMRGIHRRARVLDMARSMVSFRRRFVRKPQ